MSVGLVVGAVAGYGLGYYEEQQRLLCERYYECVPMPFSQVRCLYSAGFYALLGAGFGLIASSLVERKFPPKVTTRAAETEGGWPPAPKS